MRLCIVMGGHWEAQMGGAQFQAKCLLEALRGRQDFAIFYVANRVPAARERDGYKIVPIRAFGLPSARMLSHVPSVYWALRRLRPDVIYQRSLSAYSGICAHYAVRHGARFVLHLASANDARRSRHRGLRPDDLLLRAARGIAEYGLRHATAIVTQTEDQAELLRAEYGLEATAIVPNFHPPPEESPAPRPRALRRVIWVANFKRVKCPERFVGLAAAFAQRSDVEFVMIGRPGERAVYAQLHERMRQLPNL